MAQKKITETAREYMYLLGNIRSILQMEAGNVPHSAGAELFRSNGIPMSNERYSHIAEGIQDMKKGAVPNKQVAALVAAQKSLDEGFDLAPQPA